MRAAQTEMPDRRTRVTCTKRAGLRPAPSVAILAFCALLAGCGQRGPLYYPVLPPLNAADMQMPAGLPMLRTLPVPQSPLMDGTPTTIIAAPAVSLPEAGESTMPVATRPQPANTPVLTPEQTAPLFNGGSGSSSSSGAGSSAGSGAGSSAGSSASSASSSASSAAGSTSSSVPAAAGSSAQP